MRRCGLLLSLAVAGLGLVGLVGASAWASTAAVGGVEIVFENPSYATLGVGADGVAYGVQTDRSTPVWAYRLYRSSDEGRNWQARYDFPSGSRIRGISVLRSGTLLLHLVYSDEYLYRSDDGGQTWSQVLHFPLGYGTLTSHTVTDDGSFAYAASYNSISGSGPFTNWVWRSADDGRTWSVVRTATTFRHAHAIQVDPFTGWVYTLWGDEGVAAIERSRDHGASWETVCSGNQCLAVDIAFGPDGTAVFGLDSPFAAGKIQRLDTTTGQSTTVSSMAGTSFSAFRHQGAFLVGSTHEPQGAYPAGDTNLHLYLSNDEGRSFSDAFQIPYGSAVGYYELRVQFAYPSGNFPIQVSGRGTIVARLVGSTPTPVPVNTGLPAVSGTPRAGVTLSVSNGTWSNAPTAFAYQWQRCNASGGACSAIGSATASSYGVSTQDVGSTLRVVVTASNAGGPASATSAATAVVVAAPSPAPVPVTPSGAGGGGGGGGGAPADLSLTSTASRATAAAGETILYRIETRVKNLGETSGVSRAIVTAVLPTGVELVSSRVNRGPGCTGTATVSCDLDFLSGELVGAIELVVRVVTPGALVMTASVRAPEIDPDLANNTATTTVQAPASVLTPPTSRPVARTLTYRSATPGVPVRAARARGTAVVEVVVANDGPATVELAARDPRTGARIALQRGSRLAATVGQTSSTSLTSAVAGARTFRVRAVFAASAITPGRIYLLVVSGSSKTGTVVRPVTIRFRG